MNKRKLYGTLIAVIAFAILIAGATFAWFIYSFNATNGVYNTATVCFDINSSEGQDIDTTLDYVTKPIDGVNTSVSMGLANNCVISANGVIYLNVLSTTSSTLYSTVSAHCENPDTLETLYNYENSSDCTTNNGVWVTTGTALKYAIYDTSTPTSNTTPIKVGYINQSGDNLLYETTLKIGATDTYYIYFWLDGELIDENYMNVLFSGHIHANATQNAIHVEKILNGNDPVLIDGLIPILLSDNDNGSTPKVASENDMWYNYRQKKWANAVLVKEDGTKTREYYQTHPGEIINGSDILAYFVWIPRFSYRVWAYDGNDSSGSPSAIEIRFTSGAKETATKNGEWQTPPAFTDTLNTGFWVGKFETSHTTLSSSTTENNLGCTISSCAATSFNGLRVLPNVSSLRYNNISNLFYAIRKMTANNNTFGLTSEANTHMIKNSEWAAIAYLSHSKYGINGQINYNNVSNYKTGCGALTPNATASATCTNAYGGTVEEFPQSTTGNVTGVFDMVGGTVEYVMANYNDEVGESGFSSMPASQYYDKFTIQNINNCHNGVCLGHALNETAGWYNGRTNMVNSSARWLYRGESWTNRETASIFSFIYTNGAVSGSPNVTTRIVL